MEQVNLECNLSSSNADRPCRDLTDAIVENKCSKENNTSSSEPSNRNFNEIAEDDPIESITEIFREKKGRFGEPDRRMEPTTEYSNVGQRNELEIVKQDTDKTSENNSVESMNGISSETNQDEVYGERNHSAEPTNDYTSEVQTNELETVKEVTSGTVVGETSEDETFEERNHSVKSVNEYTSVVPKNQLEIVNKYTSAAPKDQLEAVKEITNETNNNDPTEKAAEIFDEPSEDKTFEEYDYSVKSACENTEDAFETINEVTDDTNEDDPIESVTEISIEMSEDETFEEHDHSTESTESNSLVHEDQLETAEDVTNETSKEVAIESTDTSSETNKDETFGKHDESVKATNEDDCMVSDDKFEIEKEDTNETNEVDSLESTDISSETKEDEKFGKNDKLTKPANEDDGVVPGDQVKMAKEVTNETNTEVSRESTGVSSETIEDETLEKQDESEKPIKEDTCAVPDQLETVKELTNEKNCKESTKSINGISHEFNKDETSVEHEQLVKSTNEYPPEVPGSKVVTEETKKNEGLDEQEHDSDLTKHVSKETSENDSVHMTNEATNNYTEHQENLDHNYFYVGNSINETGGIVDESTELHMSEHENQNSETPEKSKQDERNLCDLYRKNEEFCLNNIVKEHNGEVFKLPFISLPRLSNNIVNGLNLTIEQDIQNIKSPVLARTNIKQSPSKWKPKINCVTSVKDDSIKSVTKQNIHSISIPDDTIKREVYADESENHVEAKFNAANAIIKLEKIKCENVETTKCPESKFQQTKRGRKKKQNIKRTASISLRDRKLPKPPPNRISARNLKPNKNIVTSSKDVKNKKPGPLSARKLETRSVKKPDPPSALVTTRDLRSVKKPYPPSAKKPLLRSVKKCDPPSAKKPDLRSVKKSDPPSVKTSELRSAKKPHPPSAKPPDPHSRSIRSSLTHPKFTTNDFKRSLEHPEAKDSFAMPLKKRKLHVTFADEQSPCPSSNDRYRRTSFEKKRSSSTETHVSFHENVAQESNRSSKIPPKTGRDSEDKKGSVSKTGRDSEDKKGSVSKTGRNSENKKGSAAAVQNKRCASESNQGATIQPLRNYKKAINLFYECLCCDQKFHLHEQIKEHVRGHFPGVLTS